MLAWLMDNARGDEKFPWNLTLRVLTVNFAAIHTTSMTFTHILYNLAAMPQYIQPLRKEVEAVVAKDGWSKKSLTKMCKLDSFIRECLRFNATLGAISMVRKAVKDFAFSDGTIIPKNTFVCVAAFAMHHDDANYANANIFDPFRSADTGITEGEGIKHQIAATNPSFLVFGHGKHACPGRFLAANEIKAMLAHLVLNYDVKLENEGVRPSDMWFMVNCIPNRTAEVLFRRRQD